jgi:hypothetical protein
MTYRKRRDGIKTEASRYLGISLGENLPTAQVVPGIKVARAWLRLWCGTWEPYVTKLKKGVIQTEACYIRDGGRPSGGALQREPPNHRTLLRLRAAVVSSAETANYQFVRCEPRRRTQVNR